MTPDRIAGGVVCVDPAIRVRARAVVEDMNRAMAWNIAGVGRRTRDAATEAARRSGMRLDDWLDEAIAGYVGLDQADRPERDEARDDRLDAAAGRLERIARRNALSQAPRVPGIPDAFEAVIERFDLRLSRAEVQAARAFETVAQILERNDVALDGERRALIDAVRRLEAIRTDLAGTARNDETHSEHAARGPALDPKPLFDLKSAVSQIAMRRHEIEARLSRGETDPAPPDPQTIAFNDAVSAPPLTRHNPEAAEDDSRTKPPVPDAAPPLTQLLLEDVRALARQLDEMRRERAEPSAAAIDLSAMRAEIVAMGQSLADLAPRNAVVALEGAIRDLAQRVEMLRQSGHGESVLAPLEAMAAEFRAALRAHDPQAGAAALEREIRVIGGKIDSLAAAAINPETFERIRRQTEEVRNLLASAALRAPPLERLERQIGELADRVERLGVNPAPHFESAEVAALLAEACRQIERSTTPEALTSIEQRLEQIAARLDQEIARPTAPAVNPGPFDDLALRIDGIRQSLEARPPAKIDTGPIEALLRDFDAKLAVVGRTDADARALQSIFVEISGKLDRLADPEAGARRLEPIPHEFGTRLDAVPSPIDLNPIETLLRSLETKFEASAAAPVDREVVEKVADEVVRRLQDVSARQVDLEAVSHRIDRIYDRIDALAAKAARADDPQPVVHQLLEKLREADRVNGSLASETSAAINAALGVHLAELRAAQAGADQRTQSRLADLQGVLETLATRLASIEIELAADDVDEELRPPARSTNPAPPVSSALPGVEALSPEVAPQRSAQPKAGPSADELPSQSANGEDFLIEPGAGAPQRAREARELAQMIGPKTNPAVSVHIAAARRAAQAALAENSGVSNRTGVVQTLVSSERMLFAARGVQNARAFYASHRRTVLLGVAIALAATLAVRMVGIRAPFLQRSELGGQGFKTATLNAPTSKPSGGSGAVRSSGESIDVAPTASIAQPPTKLDAPNLASESGPPASDLLAAIPPGISSPLRDAVAAGLPAAQYELATRLFEGRGLPKDQPAAARWFERAASAGVAPAQYRLGAMYEKGVGVARDPAAAKRWYLKAAQSGNARAAHNLAVMSAAPDGGEPNYLEAAKWFRRGAELGVRDSQYNLAILYARGFGVEKDLGQSWLWFSLAAQQGDADAAKKRDEIVGEMDPASLATATEALAKFKALRRDPAANEVAAPPAGWDAKAGSSPLGQNPTPTDPAHPEAPL
jgi:localization factor PodJL